MCLLSVSNCSFICLYITLTCNAAEKAKAGGAVSLVAVGKPLPREGRDWDCHGDGFVELPSPGLHGNDRTEGCSVTKDFLNSVIGDRLSLREKRMWSMRDVCLLLMLILLQLTTNAANANITVIPQLTCSPTLIFLVSAPSGKEA